MIGILAVHIKLRTCSTTSKFNLTLNTELPLTRVTQHHCFTCETCKQDLYISYEIKTPRVFISIKY